MTTRTLMEMARQLAEMVVWRESGRQEPAYETSEGDLAKMLLVRLDTKAPDAVDTQVCPECGQRGGDHGMGCPRREMSAVSTEPGNKSRFISAQDSFRLSWEIHCTFDAQKRIAKRFAQACSEEGATISMAETVELAPPPAADWMELTRSVTRYRTIAAETTRGDGDD